jgi:hypothetical protein
MQPIITNLHQHSRPKIGLIIVFIFLLITILFLIIFSNKKNQQLAPPPLQSTPTPLNDISIIKVNQPPNFNSINLSAPNLFYAINQIDGSLIKITPEETTTIYSKPVESFSHLNSSLAIIDKQNKNNLIIKNLNNNQNQTIDLKNISPIVSVSFSSNSAELYLLANLNVIKRTTDLYYLSLENPIPKKLTTTTATDLEVLSSQNILLFSYADGEDLSQVSIYNLPTSTTTFTKNANRYFTSPNKISICTISSQSFSIINLPDLSEQTLNIKKALGVYWINDSELVILKNSNEGVVQATITPLTTNPIFKAIPSLKDKTLRSILGYADGQLYAINFYGQIIKTSI